MSEAIASKAERLAAYNANIAAAEKDPSLSPETGKPLSKMNAARFGAGFLVFGVLWMSGLGIVSAVLLPMHYKTIPGQRRCVGRHRQRVHRGRIPGRQPDVRQLLRPLPFPLRPPYPVDPLRSRARWRHPVPDRHHA